MSSAMSCSVMLRSDLEERCSFVILSKGRAKRQLLVVFCSCNGPLNFNEAI